MLKLSLYSLALLLVSFLPTETEDKAHKPGTIKSGEFVLQRRVTRPEVDEARFNAEYVKATASFEFATRDDMKGVNNDWDLCLLGLGTKDSPFIFAARTVTDDESLMWSVGDLALDKVTKTTPRPHSPENQKKQEWDFENCLVKSGHSYVVHTVDDNSDLWVAFRVTKIMPEKGIKIAWKLLGKPKVVKPPKSESKDS